MSPTIRFTPTMYAAALSGRKTQTRRVFAQQQIDGWNPHPGPGGSCYWYHPEIVRAGMLDAGAKVYGVASEDAGWIATYGPPGTVRPIVTTWAIAAEWDALRPSIMDPEVITAEHPVWFDDGTPKPAWAGKSRPAMFFPKQLYPLARQAEVVAVKPELVQWISEEDALAEGFPDLDGTNKTYTDRARYWFSILWDSINSTRQGGIYSWAANPWVFATTFKVLPAAQQSL